VRCRGPSAVPCRPAGEGADSEWRPRLARLRFSSWRTTRA
jgi:hypothetical protein